MLHREIFVREPLCEERSVGTEDFLSCRQATNPYLVICRNFVPVPTQTEAQPFQVAQCGREQLVVAPNGTLVPLIIGLSVGAGMEGREWAGERESRVWVWAGGPAERCA